MIVRRLALLLLVAVVGCAWVRPAVDPAPWDGYGDRGPLRVRGAPPATPGRVVFESLARDPRLRAVLRPAGEPDTVEVLGGRFAPKRIILRWERRGTVARRIVVDSTNEGLVVHSPASVRVARAAPHRGGVARAPAAPCPDCAPAPDAKPTVAQTLECPIDPTRADCRAFCTADAAHEWCARP